MYRKFKVQLKIRDKILGGIPRTEKMIEGWLKSREMSDAEDKTKAEVDIVEDEKRAWTGFKTDDEGIYLESRCVKAMIKECTTIMKAAKERRGLKQLIQHGIFVKPDKIRFGVKEPDGHVVEPHGHVELCAHVMGPQGPRSILKRHDFVQSPELDFEVWILDIHKEHRKLMDADLLKLIFELGQELGLGCSRSQGYGKFDIVEFSELEG